MQAVLKQSECRLINYSISVKDNNDFNFLLPFLKAQKRIMPNEKKLTLSQINLLTSQKDQLLKVCTNEWEPVNLAPRFGAKNVNCDLCGRPDLVELFDIKNKFTGQIITIGGSCINKFSNLKKAKGLVNNKMELERYTRLLERVPELKEIYYEGEFINHTKYITPSSLQDGYKDTERRLKLYIKKAVKKGKKEARKSLKGISLQKLLSLFFRQKSKLINFGNNTHSNNIYLLRDTAVMIENNQSNGKELISAIEKNNGIVSKRIASEIQNKIFLEQFIEAINEKLPFDIKAIATETGKFIFSVQKNNNKAEFSIESSICISDIVYSKNSSVDFNMFFTKNTKMISPYNENTMLMLLRIAENILKKQFNYIKYQPKQKEILPIIAEHKKLEFKLSEKNIKHTVSKLVNEGYLFANDEHLVIRRTASEILKISSERLYYNEQKKLMQTFAPKKLSQDKWKILTLQRKKDNSTDINKLAKKVTQHLSNMHLFYRDKPDKAINIPIHILEYIGKCNYFYNNEKIVSNSLTEYEKQALTISELITDTINFVSEKN
ncbi:hypothetical protein [Enterococcus wangshanyuanii]|uniref:Uncharacterized protein n=1 Tax=Enterococcus wangshanyuanii TaxID=2005703 RepID=A0ABQ1PFZ9_9ENTE|nr:hypothetical protein [Enterococcus wangshanyuanii]GGC96403.1 hypothetical protein GCM10011573_27510 [Enterococcus wangshanyuanii]